MKLDLLVDNEVVLVAEFDDPLQGAVDIVYVNPSLENTINQWLSEEQFILSHDEETGGYAGRTNGVDDIRAFEQRILAFVHEMGDGWTYEIEEDSVQKHLPGQHDQLSHAGIRTNRGETDPERIRQSREQIKILAEKAINNAGPEFAKAREDMIARIKAGKQTKESHIVNGKYTAERQKVHQDIKDKLLGTTQSAQTPTFTFLGGLPGSGKSTIVRESQFENTVLVDSDAIKQMLPEYQGWNAALLQDEADDIIAATLVQAARDKKNVVLDGTLKTYDKANFILDRFSSLGYKTGVIFSEVAPEEAVNRAIGRFQRGGRFVDPMYIASHDHQNKATYENLKSEVDFYSLYDNNEQGVSPKLKERGNAQTR